jgi:subtilase family serine protease
VLLAFPMLAAGAFTASHGLSLDPFHPDLSASRLSPLGEVCSKTALCPATVRSAYNFTGVVNQSATNGTGQTVVIVDACGDKNIASDLQVFDTRNGLPTANLTVIPYGTGKSCVNGAWSAETSLDVEWAHVLAPGAKIVLIVAARSNSSNMYGAWNYSISHHLGNQISNSWGGNGGCMPFMNAALANAAKANVTILASSGDSSAWGKGTGQKSQNPADCRSILTVGGTALGVTTKGAYSSERAWVGSGGGYYGGSKEPFYQKKANISDPYGLLGKPDVSAVADPGTGVWVYNSPLGGWFTVGGTSVSCPMWAGLVADANEVRAAHGFAPLGSFNAYLYQVIYGVDGTGAHYAQDFHDVTTGSNGWSAGTGWDAVTGLGSFNGYPLIQQLGTDPKA